MGSAGWRYGTREEDSGKFFFSGLDVDARWVQTENTAPNKGLLPLGGSWCRYVMELERMEVSCKCEPVGR